MGGEPTRISDVPPVSNFGRKQCQDAERRKKRKKVINCYHTTAATTTTFLYVHTFILQLHAGFRTFLIFFSKKKQELKHYPLLVLARAVVIYMITQTKTEKDEEEQELTHFIKKGLQFFLLQAICGKSDLPLHRIIKTEVSPPSLTRPPGARGKKYMRQISEIACLRT